MSREHRGRHKGSYGGGLLPIARSYPLTDRRRRLLLLGGAAALLVFGFLGARVLLGDRRPLAPGPISSAHAALARDCAACHGKSGAADSMNDRCTACHLEVEPALTVPPPGGEHSGRSEFSLQVHAARLGQGTETEGGWQCRSCHAEHQGEATLQPGDGGCATCHDAAPFADRHPEFSVHDSLVPTPRTLRFQHAGHLQRVVDEGLAADARTVCLNCHEPRDDGASFSEISFDRHCSSCHLNGAQSTEWLPVAENPSTVDPQSPGVLTLEQLAQQVPPPLWLSQLGAGAVRSRGSSVRRIGLTHADPWVLANLSRLRTANASEANRLGALLDTASAAETQRQREVLTRSAVEKLRRQLAALRQLDDPALAAETQQLQETLRLAERRIARGELLDAESLPVGRTNRQRGSQFGDSASRPVRELAESLLVECTTCHVLEGEAGLRLLLVDPRLGVLDRARFDHQSHLIDTPCQSCHEGLSEVAGETDGKTEISVDAEHHLPSVTKCQECHRDGGAEASCRTCHQAHPPSSSLNRFQQHLAVGSDAGSLTSEVPR